LLALPAAEATAEKMIELKMVDLIIKEEDTAFLISQINEAVLQVSTRSPNVTVDHPGSIPTRRR